MKDCCEDSYNYPCNDTCTYSTTNINFVGSTGPPGPPGAPGIINISNFYALMPGDNAATVAVGGSVEFPNDGPSNGIITSTSASTFLLPDIAIYEVTFQVSVTEPGQLVVAINGVEIPYTVVGRATGTSQIIGLCLIETTVVNSTLSINNPVGNAVALTITPLSGGASAVSAHLVVKQFQTLP